MRSDTNEFSRKITSPKTIKQNSDLTVLFLFMLWSYFFSPPLDASSFFDRIDWSLGHTKSRLKQRPFHLKGALFHFLRTFLLSGGKSTFWGEKSTFQFCRLDSRFFFRKVEKCLLCTVYIAQHYCIPSIQTAFAAIYTQRALFYI